VSDDDLSQEIIRLVWSFWSFFCFLLLLKLNLLLLLLYLELQFFISEHSLLLFYRLSIVFKRKRDVIVLRSRRERLVLFLFCDFLILYLIFMCFLLFHSPNLDWHVYNYLNCNSCHNCPYLYITCNLSHNSYCHL
jgi:hypothetical protein